MKNEDSKQSETRNKPSQRKIIIFAGVLVVLAIATLVYILSIDQDSSGPDPASEQVIRQATAKQINKDTNKVIDPNDLTDEDFATVTELIIFEAFSDAKFLEKYSNLQELSLVQIEFPKKEKPKWMKIMAKFGLMDLNERHSIDLSSLEKLSKLQKLVIYQTEIFSIESISKLKHLKEFDCYLTSVSDLEPIKEMINLQRLQIGYTLVRDLKPIDGLTNLEFLDLSGTQVSDIGPLKGLTKLQELRLNQTQVSDLEPIKGLTSLENLYLYKTQVCNLEPLKELENLKILDLNKTQVSDLEPLKSLKNLQQLEIFECENISDDQIRELEKALPKLRISGPKVGR